MGGNSHKILQNFQVDQTDKDEWTFDRIKQRFEEHFVGRTNIIFERARFNRRIQKENESVIDFLEDLHKLAKTCDFGNLRNELIRDRIVVGIRNIDMSNKLMQDEKLDLDKAIKRAKAAEMVKAHQVFLQGDNNVKIAAVHRKNSTRRYQRQPDTQKYARKEVFLVRKTPATQTPRMPSERRHMLEMSTPRSIILVQYADPNPLIMLINYAPKWSQPSTTIDG
jgi:hypothetical protein